MRRTVICGLVLLVAAAVPAAAAPGDRQTTHSTVKVTQRVTALDVSLPVGSVVVRRGSSSTVDIVKTFDRDEPEVTVGVKDGVLHVDGRCPPVKVGPLVTVFGFSSCTVDVVVTLPQRALDTAVDTDGRISLTDFAGTHDLSSGIGPISVKGTSGPKLTTHVSSGATDVQSVRTDSLDLQAGAQTISLARSVVRGAAVLDTSSGDVQVADSSAGSFDLSTGGGRLLLQRSRTVGRAQLDSSSGDLTVEDLVADRLRLSTGGGEVRAERVVTRGPADLDASSGNLVVRQLTSRDLTLSTGGGNVDLDQVVTRTLDVRSSSGPVTAADVAAGDIDVSTGSGDVVLAATGALDRLVADTSSGAVTVTVPRGTYALTTDATSGQVTVDGLTVDSAAARRLDLSTGSGDITVRGR